MAVLEALSDAEKYLYCLLQDTSGIDQAEMLWHAPDNPDGCFRLWPFQWAWWRCTDPLQISQCARPICLNTPIPTPGGWKRMGDIVVGDLVYDEMGNPTTVTAVSPIYENRPCYEIVFDDHTAVVADEDHLWLTWDKKARVARNPNRRGRPIPAVRTTKEIKESLRVAYSNERNHSIKNANPLQAPEADLLLDPYYLGFWLGDGNTTTSEITTADRWVLEELERRGLSIVPRSNLLLYGVTFSWKHNRKTESVQALLRRIGVLGYKHIPAVYLRASERQRRDLLAGLVDSDGHMQKNGSCEITQKVFPVAEGLIELLRSLGEKPRMVKRTAYLNGVDCGPVYRVSWRPRLNPALLPRKAAAFVAPASKAVALGERRIVDVRPVESRPVRCITVGAESHLFLVGEGMIPTHNSVGKTLSITARMFAFPFLYPGQEAVITAPELVHLEPLVSLIERRFSDCRLTRELLPKGRSAVTHRPFQMNFVNGSRIIGRIPQRDGKGVKGLHPLWLEQDESSDYPDAGWNELIETLKRGFEGAVWRAHGVTRGLRDKFYEFTQDRPDNKWKVHRFAAQWRPNWSDEERQEKIKLYGSREHPDYRRNVLGLHGDKTNPLFVLFRLMACADSDETSEYNTKEYCRLDVKEEWLRDTGGEITELLDFPYNHKAGKDQVFWSGMDVGFTSDPSEVLVFKEYRTHKDRPTKLKLITRVHLERISHLSQVKAILHVIDFYRPKAFSMDSTGNGLPLFQHIQELTEIQPELAYALDTIKGYNFSAKILVDFDKTVEVDEYHGDLEKDAGIHRRVLEYASDRLRDLVDNERLELPWDTELLGQFQGSTWSSSRKTSDQYGRKMFSKGDDHTLDAARMAVLGHAQFAIEALMAQQPNEPVFDSFVGV